MTNHMSDSTLALPQTTETHPSWTNWQVVLLEEVDPSAIEVFQKEGFSQIESVSSALSGDELQQVLRRAHLLGIRSGIQLTAQ